MPRAFVLPTEPERLEDGIIHWNLPHDIDPSAGRRQLRILVQCADCSELRPVCVHDLTRRDRPSGLCARCRHQRQATQVLNQGIGPKASRYKGSTRIDKRTGYRFIGLYPGDAWYEEMGHRAGQSNRHGHCRYVLEHRWNMANHLGRPLERWEHVHHIDQDKLNNEIDNLMIVNGATHAAITTLETENKRLRMEIVRLRQALARAQSSRGKSLSRRPRPNQTMLAIEF